MSASSPSTSSTPHFRATARTRSSASRTPSRWIGITAARLTGGIGDPADEAGRPLGALSVGEVEDKLTISLWPGKPGVYDPLGLCPAREQRLRHLHDDSALHLRVAHDALRRLRATGLEL